MKVGDSVLYVPDLCYALSYDKDGNYPWEMGWKRSSHLRSRPGQEVTSENIEILSTAKRRREVLTALHRHPNPKEERKKLVFTKPIQFWKSKVRKINENGTVDIDVQHNTGGVTLHLDNIKVDPEGKTPNTCHELVISQSQGTSQETIQES